MNQVETKFTRFIKYIKTKFNRIQFRIVTIFLVLMIAAAIAIITLNYKENQIAITETSLITTRQIGIGVIQNLDSIIDGVEMLTTATTSLIASPADISPNNQTLINYLLSTLVQNPLIAIIHIAGVDGSFIAATNLTLTGQHQYHFNLTKDLPEGVRYGIITITHSNNTSTEEWKYLDTSFQVSGTEQNSPASLNPRISPWYTEVAVWPRTAWTNPYNITPNTEGISFAVPVIINDVLVAVVGTDLALSALSRIITNTVVGKTGKAFVLNTFGEIILPQIISGTMPYIIEEGYNNYTKNNQKSFILDEPDISYVIDVFDFPLDINTTWIIMTAVPLGDFFNPIIQSDIHSIQIGFFILIIATILIYYAAGRIAKPINKLAEEVERIRNFDFTETTPIQSNVYEISLLSYSIQTMRKTFASFTKYVPKDIVKKLLSQEHDLITGGERRTMTILFSDIENFTTVAETLSVEQVTSTLTEYFEEFTKIIVQNEGTIDKYIGDSVMAIWNAPNPVINHAEKACISCLDFIALTKTSKSTNLFLNGTTRFGINTGEVIVGNIGTTERISYTAIGTVVNTAARFQSLNKTYNTTIIIGETVKESISTRLVTRPLDLLAVKGRNQPIQIYELMGVSIGEPKALLLTPDQISLCKDFTEAFNSFHKGDIQEAKDKFTTLSKKFPLDEPTKIYLERLNKN